MHKTPFQWMSVEQDAYDCLRKMLSKVLVVQLSDWNKPFHVFVDASDVESEVHLCSYPNQAAIDQFTTLVGNFRQQKGVTRQLKGKH